MEKGIRINLPVRERLELSTIRVLSLGYQHRALLAWDHALSLLPLYVSYGKRKENYTAMFRWRSSALEKKKKTPDRRLRSADSANGPSHLVMLFFNALKINTEITELRNGFSQKFKSFRKQYTITCMTGITSNCSKGGRTGQVGRVLKVIIHEPIRAWDLVYDVIIMWWRFSCLSVENSRHLATLPLVFYVVSLQGNQWWRAKCRLFSQDSLLLPSPCMYGVTWRIRGGRTTWPKTLRPRRIMTPRD